MDIFNWQRSWGRLQPLFTIWCHLLCCILPFAKYMSGFYPPIDFIHQFPGRLSKHHLPVFLLIHITRQLISLATLQDRPCKHLLYWFCIQPEGLARPTEQIEREDISHIWVPECRYRSRMTHPDVTWGAYDAGGSTGRPLKSLDCDPSPPELSYSNPHSWIQAKQGSVILGRRRLKSGQDCFHSSVSIFVELHPVTACKYQTVILAPLACSSPPPHPSVGHQHQLHTETS